MSLPLPQIEQSAESLSTPIALWTWVETAPGSGLYELVPFQSAAAAPDTFHRTAATASGHTTVVAAGVERRLLGYVLEVTGDAAFAAAAPLVITIGDLVHRIWVPASADAALSGVLYSTGFVGLGALGIDYDAATAIVINLSAALTRGAVNINVQYR